MSSSESGLQDRFNHQNQLHFDQLRYTGAGHSDFTKLDWFTHQQRDSFASYVGHSPMIDFFSCVQNQSRARVRFDLINKIPRPMAKSKAQKEAAKQKNNNQKKVQESKEQMDEQED